MLKDDLPLFVINDDPIAVYVINNKVIGLKTRSWKYTNHSFAYFLLGKLFMDKNVNSVIPNEILAKHKMNFSKIDVNNPCFCGGISIEHYADCLTSKLRVIMEKGTHFVQFYDIALLSSQFIPGMYVKYLKDTVTLTPYEAFLLLSNLCLSAQHFRSNLKTITGSTIDIEAFRNSYSNYYDIINGSTSNQRHIIEAFCIDYLIYIAEQLKTNSI